MAVIAVAEDNTPLRHLIEAILTRAGHEVTCYADGAAALMALQERPSDLVVSDVQMPRLDGLSLCKALRQRYARPRLPILLVSVLDAEEDIVAGLEAGANDYLLKPFSADVLRAKVAYQLASVDKTAAPPTEREGPLELERLSVFPYEFERYTLLSELGHGSYGEVYRARRGDEQEVALKLLSRVVNADRQLLGRYFREVALLQEVRSDKTARFVDAGFAHGRFYLVMELVTGRSAWELREDGPQPVARALQIGVDVAEALSAIHARGLVHRDVKSANVIVSPEGRATLVDFGLVKEPNERGLTSSSIFLGTAEYVAPEVINGAQEHAGSDIYALGITLYELLTGQFPIADELSTINLLRRISDGEPTPSAADLRADVPFAVSRLVDRLRDPDPRRRPASGAEVADALRKLLDEVAT